jgi:hypothetical protein
MNEKFYPKLELKRDVDADIENCIHFVGIEEKDKQFLIKMFLPDKLHYILDSDFSEKEKKRIIEEYARSFYQINKKEIELGIKKVKKEWEGIEKQYFQITDNIFKSHPWPKGEYTGVVSIWQMFPRHIDEKIFFFPYNNQDFAIPIKTIAHEMLHFIFFDYLEKNYNLKEDSVIKNKSEDYVWMVSEVFNNVIENWKPYREICGGETKPYFDDKGLFEKMKKDWEEKEDVDFLIKRQFNI